jgi:hypothetical protein
MVATHYKVAHIGIVRIVPISYSDDNSLYPQRTIFVDGLWITEQGNSVRGTICRTCSASDVFGRRNPSGDRSPNNASNTIVVPRPILLEICNVTA